MEKEPELFTLEHTITLSEKMQTRIQRYRFVTSTQKHLKKKPRFNDTLISLINQALKQNGY